MEEKLKRIKELGYDFILLSKGDYYRISISRPEWTSSDIYQSVRLPTWDGENIEEIIDECLEFVS